MIVGTAGHIDHGKTSLVRRLTGIDTDRLKEEKARGISIDLGFAYWPRPDGTIVGFVDVPGHEKLVHNMLAGATGIDFVLLVIAADDGVKPQTLEHLAIIDLLGLDRGIVALNKCDRVEPDRLASLTAEIRALLAPTSLSSAEILPVSALTGANIELLASQLDRAVSATEPATSHGLFRMSVDRRFTLPGLGTAATGTVLSGSVSVDDAVVISPRGLEARVRSIHAQDKPAIRGVTGERCALVLSGQGITTDVVHRGDVVLAPLLHAPTARIDANLRVLPSEARPAGQWMPVKLHHAAAEVAARLVVLRDEPLLSGERGFVQLVLERPIAAANGDRFVIRDASATRTIGGGVFVDVNAPERKRRTPERIVRLHAMAISDPVEAVRALLAIPGAWLDLDRFARARALCFDTLLVDRAMIDLELLGSKSHVAMSRATWASLASSIAGILDRHHAEQPDLPGLGLEHLRRQLRPMLPADLFLDVLRRLAASRQLVVDRTWVRRPGHQVRLSEVDKRTQADILNRIEAEPYRPPRVRDLAKAMALEEGEIRRLLRLSARHGDVEEIAHDHYFTRPVVERMAAIAIDIAAASPDGRFSAADFRDRLDNGRKVAIQILEFFDTHGFTIRRQDLRRINPARVSFFAPGSSIGPRGKDLQVDRAQQELST